jgi:hypothetical protein
VLISKANAAAFLLFLPWTYLARQYSTALKNGIGHE